MEFLNTNNTYSYQLISYSKDINYQTWGFNTTNLTEETIKKNFDWLEQNSLDNQRILSTLDFYKISGTVTKDTVQSDFNNIVRNSSIVVSGVGFSFNGENYVSGDLIYKQSNGEPLLLRLAGGLYYPKLETINMKIHELSNQASSQEQKDQWLHLPIYHAADVYNSDLCNNYSSRASAVSWSNTEILEGTKNWIKDQWIWLVIYEKDANNIRTSNAYLSLQQVQDASHLLPSQNLISDKGKPYAIASTGIHWIYTTETPTAESDPALEYKWPLIQDGTLSYSQMIVFTADTPRENIQITKSILYQNTYVVIPIVKGYVSVTDENNTTIEEEVFWNFALYQKEGHWFINNVPNYIEKVVIK